MNLISAQNKYMTFSGCIWLIGGSSWWMVFAGEQALGTAFTLVALLLAYVREVVFAVEVRDLNR